MTGTSWWSAAPELLLAAGWVFVPGLALVLALGYRRGTVLLAAPAVSVGLLAGLAVVFAAVGVPWNVPAVAVAVSLLAGATVALRWAFGRRGVPASHEKALLVDHRPRSAKVPVLAGVVAGGLLSAVPLAHGLRPDFMLQTWDNVFQLSATRFVIETANASPFHLQQVSHQVGESVAIYPAAWHGIAALGTIGSVLTGTNALIMVVAGAVWPCGVAALARVAVPKRPMVAVLAPIVGAGFFAFPTVMLGFGWPNALAVALIPGALALTLSAVGDRAASTGRRILTALLAVVGLGGVGLAHPNGALTFAIVATPAVVAGAVRAAVGWARRARTRGGAVLGAALPLAGAVAWCVGWTAAVVLSGRQIGDTSQTGTSGFRNGVWLALTGATGQRALGLTLVVLLAVGVGVVLWRRRAVWLLFSLAAITALAGVAESVWPLKSITRAWFMDPARFRGPTVVFAAIVIAIGLAALGQAAANGVLRLVSRDDDGARRADGVGPMRRERLTVVTTALVALALVVSTGALAAGERRSYFAQIGNAAAAPEVDYNLVSAPELEMIARAGDTLEPGRRVLGTPLNGSTLLYVVSNVPVVFTNFSGRWPDEAFFLADHFAEIHENPEVCQALRRLDIGYYYADSTVFNPAHPFHASYAGLPGDPPQPGFELVDQGGGARIYRVTACD